jgi:hypothetical protein
VKHIRPYKNFAIQRAIRDLAEDDHRKNHPRRRSIVRRLMLHLERKRKRVRWY